MRNFFERGLIASLLTSGFIFRGLVKVYDWKYLDIIYHCNLCTDPIFSVIVVQLKAESIRCFPEYALGDTLCRHEYALEFLKFDSFRPLWKTVY